ncbi:ADP-ribosyl cyclase/cyclic ADP-ribose hydrolase-like [Oscarella lobularis]|uniref:ADP-ribosyl cyclase/cyclic ADP-ribose hydrolase-like n=1 Tax=Oscarella lobularis TaxID=121494 RepID=UPI00331361AB
MPRIYFQFASTIALLFLGANSQTTPGIQEMFLGRCEYFKEFGYQQPKPVICSEAWNAFFKAFGAKDPCTVSIENYTSYFSMTSKYQTPPRDMTLLWSGTQELKSVLCADGIHCYANDQFMPSYLVGKMNWCGSKTDPSGMNFTGCRSYDRDDCPKHVTYSFWAAASQQLALASTGVVRLLLDGTRTNGSAYSRDSFFAKYELPNLNPSRVTALEAIVALTPGQPVKEDCDSASMLLLKNDVANQNLPYRCIMNPPVVKHASCGFFADQPATCNFQYPLLANKRRQLKKYTSQDSI